MNQQIVPAPVVKDVTVRVEPGKAFDVFVSRIGTWWPRSHSLSKAGQADVTIQSRAGGRWYETGKDGAECDWGHVIVWEPGKRLLLSWQIDADWAFDPDLLTEIEVIFEPVDGGTRVRLAHRLLERYGERAAEVALEIGAEGGWPGILQSYCDCCADDC
jgi:uncharacterized protein YndB with AHSA1/START domain